MGFIQTTTLYPLNEITSTVDQKIKYHFYSPICQSAIKIQLSLGDISIDDYLYIINKNEQLYGIKIGNLDLTSKSAYFTYDQTLDTNFRSLIFPNIDLETKLFLPINSMSMQMITDSSKEMDYSLQSLLVFNLNISTINSITVKIDNLDYEEFYLSDDIHTIMGMKGKNTLTVPTSLINYNTYVQNKYKGNTFKMFYFLTKNDLTKAGFKNTYQLNIEVEVI